MAIRKLQEQFAEEYEKKENKMSLPNITEKELLAEVEKRMGQIVEVEPHISVGALSALAEMATHLRTAGNALDRAIYAIEKGK